MLKFVSFWFLLTESYQKRLIVTCYMSKFIRTRPQSCLSICDTIHNILHYWAGILTEHDSDLLPSSTRRKKRLCRIGLRSLSKNITGRHPHTAAILLPTVIFSDPNLFTSASNLRSFACKTTFDRHGLDVSARIAIWGGNGKNALKTSNWGCCDTVVCSTCFL
jgi:hypothetical protein